MEERSKTTRRRMVHTGLGVAVVFVLVGAGVLRLTAPDGELGATVLGASTKKDTTPPSVSIVFPVRNTTYGTGTWNGCAPPGICGTAIDATTVASVSVAVQLGKGKYWNGTGFASSSPVYQPATLTSTSHDSVNWVLPFPLPDNGAYTVYAKAKDSLANASKPISMSFEVDTSAESNKPFGISGTFTGSFAPGLQQRLDLVLNNPYSFPLKVTGVTVKVETTTTKAGCVGTQNLEVVTQAAVTSLSPVTVPAGPGTIYALTGDQRPLLHMPNLIDINQDACKGATFTLSYTGTATK
jgi:hypothetical protein